MILIKEIRSKRGLDGGIVTENHNILAIEK